MGDARAYSSVRFGVSRFTTDEEIDYVLGKLPDAVARLRRLSAPARRVDRPEPSLV